VHEDKFRQFVSPDPNLVVKSKLSELEDDPENLWGLDKIGVYKIKSEFPDLTGKGVRVGILDTGIQDKHEEFKRVDASGATYYNTIAFKDFVNSLDNAYDDHGHGTHVAGTISGSKVGIAPDASLIVGKVFTASGFGQDSTILEAMQWVFDPDSNPSTDDYAQLVSNSWGADLSGTTALDINDHAPYWRAVKAWIAGGVVPIFAAGNSGKAPNGMPAALPESLSVGAINSTSGIASFSSRGPNAWMIGNLVLTYLKPDISAPGVDITSSFPGNKYATWSGTSMATPHVSGSVALLLQANSKLNYGESMELMLQSVERKVDIKFGFGILSAYDLLKKTVKKLAKK
jgi:subtilisin family serine protease